MPEKTVSGTNLLIYEKSPYLKQHAYNPVGWRPWSKETLAKAKEEDRPLLISIGYASCHWCHVMEKESFEDPETAGIMNENFVSVKIDREERPDLDRLYMKAVQAMTGRGGWPLTVFATPEGIPFYGGTYFPPEDSHGLPSFKKILLAVSLAYRKNRERIGSVTSDIMNILKERAPSRPVELTPAVSDNAVETAKVFFDPVNGGFGAETKFPHAMLLRFLFRYWKRTGGAEAVSIVRKSLSAMALGGIYDHLGGGFHRYSVDERWEVPHFEKMLYDNALLTGLYSALYEALGTPLYKDAADETAHFLIRGMASPEGGFYSSMDADVDGREGLYYVWSAAEVIKVLGRTDGKKFMEYFSVTDEGNFEGENTLNVRRPLSGAEALDAAVSEEMKRMKKELLSERLKRKPPQIDNKIIAGWNGLAVSALAGASRALKRPELMDAAKRCAQFLLKGLKREDGRLLRYWLDGGADTPAGLEDYALLGGALMSIHENAEEKRWLDEASSIAQDMICLFYDEKAGLFFDTGSDQERLFVRDRDLLDNDVPSGNSAAADLLVRLFAASGNRTYLDLAEKILSSIEGMRDEPMSYGNFLSVLESYLSLPQPSARR